MQQSSTKRSAATQPPGSFQQRKEVMWNVQQPGDPYDIKKSMIAKLPGGKPFMGDELEVVCLFQAAQIQRLSDFLETYKVKFKDLERIELDRHSYEIQIKELTQKISQIDAYKKDNDKLKNFVKKQGDEIEEMQQNFRQKITEKQFNSLYGKALDKIKVLNEENNLLRSQNDNIKRQLNTYDAKVDALQRSKAKELEYLRQKMSQNVLSSVDQPTSQSNEHALNMFRIQVQGQLRKLDGEIRRLNQNNEMKNRQINELRHQKDALQRSTKDKRPLDTSTYQLQTAKHEYESRLLLLNQQVDKMDKLLKDYIARNEALNRQNIQLQQILLDKELQIKDGEAKLRNRQDQIIKLNQLIRKIETNGHKDSNEELKIQYEYKIRQLNQEIEFLNNKVRQESQKSRYYRDDDVQHSIENSSRVQSLTRQNEELRRGVLGTNELKRQVAHLQSERALSLQEIERLHEVISSKNAESSRMRILVSENENLKNKLNDVERTWAIKHENQMIRLTTQHETRLKQLSQMQGNQFQSKILMLERQLDRQKDLLRIKNEQTEKERTTSYEMQTINKQWQNEIRNYDAMIHTLRKENDDLANRLRQLSDVEHKMVEYQTKASRWENQSQHLTGLVRTREEQNSALRQRIIENEENHSRINSEANRKLNQYAQNQVFFKNENQQLKRKMNQLISNTNNVSKEIVNENNRLTITLRNVQEQKLQIENRNRQNLQEIDYLKQTLNTSNREKEEFRKVLAQLEGNNKNLLNQSSSTMKILQYENQNYKRQIIQFKNHVANYQSELARRGNSYEQNLNVLTRENEELRKKIRQAQVGMSQLSIELQRLNNRQKQKDEEMSRMENSYRSAIGETENLRKYLKEYEVSVNSKFEGQISRNYTTYETKIQNLTRQLQDSRKRYTQLDARYLQLANEYERLNVNHKNINQELQNLRRQMANRDGMISNFQSDVTKAIAKYEAELSNLTRHNQDLQRRTNENDQKMRLKLEENNRLEANYRNLLQDHEDLRRRYNELEHKFNQKIQGEVSIQFRNYERNISQLKQQNEELGKALNDATSELNRRIRQINSLSQAVGENEDLRRKLASYDSSINVYQGQVSKRFSIFEQNLKNLTKQNQDLKRQLSQIDSTARRITIDNGDKVLNLTRELDRVNVNLKLVEKQNIQLRNRQNQSGQLSRILAQVENKYMITSQELQRVNENLRNKIDDLKNLQLKNNNLQTDLQYTRRKQVQLQSRSNQNYESQLLRKCTSYEQTISDLRRKLVELQAINQNLTIQLQRYNKNLLAKGDESSHLSKNYANLQRQYEQLKRSVRDMEASKNQNYYDVKRENDQYKKRFNQYDIGIRQIGEEFQRKRAEYQSRIAILKQEIQRLNLKLKDYEIALNQKGDFDIKNKITSENTINTLNRENQDLRRKILQMSNIGQKLPDYQQKLNHIINQNENLQFSLRTKTDELNNADAKLRHNGIQIENLKLQIAELQRSLSNKYQYEINRKTTNLQQNLKRLKQEREDLQRKKFQQESRINILMSEIDRLNEVLRGKTDQMQKILVELQHYKERSQKRLLNNESELTTLQANYQKVSGQYQRQKKYLQQYQFSTQRLQGEFQRLQKDVEQLRIQRQSLIDKNLILSNEIQRLSQQNKQLQDSTRDARLRMVNQSALQKRINEHLALMVVLFAEIETLRKRVADKEQEVENVRRSSLSPHMIKR